jgi:hypothetical protein
MRNRAFATIVVLSMAILTLSSGVQAEETAEIQADNGTAEEKPVSYMFVQSAQSGTLVPVAGADNRYILTLMGTSPQTIAFSHRPERVVGQVPLQKFLDGMCFSPENGPNAALEILEANEEEDLAVVELFDPEYDAANKTLKYNVSIVSQPNLSYAVFNERADKALPETFGPAALFIDDCADGYMTCAKSAICPVGVCTMCDDVCGKVPTGCCWHLGDVKCYACHSDEYYAKECRKKYGQDCTKYICDMCKY